MQFLVMLILSSVVSNGISGVRVGIVYNASLLMIPTSSIIMNQSVCHESLCALLTTIANSSTVSLNCYTENSNHAMCQLFTVKNYYISTFYQLETNVTGTFCFLQLPENNQSQTTNSGGCTDAESSTLSSITTTAHSIVTIIRAGDSIVGIYNTTAGASTEGNNGRYLNGIQFSIQAINNSISTKYLNFGGTGGYSLVVADPEVGTRFYVTASISNASTATGLRFTTRDDYPNRDPITATREGSNTDVLDLGSSWILIYNGSAGISPTADPGRNQYVIQQNLFSNIAFESYRLLVTSQRGSECSVQYSEAQSLGYI